MALGLAPLGLQPLGLGEVPLASSSGVTGTAALVNANDAISAFGATTIVGAAALINANDTVTASGSAGTAVTGTAAIVNANDTVSATGTTTITGSAAVTNANDTLAASGVVGSISGTAAITNANDTVSATGTSGTVTPPNSSIGGSGGAGRSYKNRKFNELIDKLFAPDADIREVVERAVPDSADTGQVTVAIAKLEAAYDLVAKAKQSTVRKEIRHSIAKLETRLQELEDEEAAVISLLLN